MDNNTDNNSNHNVGSTTPRQQDATITEAKTKSMEMTESTTIATPPSLSVFFMPSGLLSSLVPQSQLEGTIPEHTLETQSKAETPTSVTAPAVVSSLNSVVPSCRICGITRFENVERQREHVKLDWHRYNLKQQLMDKKATPITEQQFENMIQDLSSISGSDDDHEDDDTSDNDSSNNKKNNNNSRKINNDGNNGGQEALVRSLMAKLEVSIMDNERTRHQDPALIYRQQILEQQLQEAKASPLIWFTSAVYGPTVHLGIYKNALPNRGHCDNLTEYLRTLQFPEVHIAKKQKNNRARREARRIAAEQDDAAAQGVSLVKENSAQEQQQHLTTTKQEPANVDVGQLEQSRANNPEKIDGVDDVHEEDEIENEQDWIQYQMMAKQQQPTAAVKSASKPRYWTLVMLGGGHFAGVVMDLAGQVSSHGRDMKVVAHKTFHRYTVRKKQGGSQASHGVANSAGARIRMYNEEALKLEVRELLNGWSHWITQSECVFVHAPGNNRKVLFYENSVMATLTSVKVSVLSKQALQQKEREEQQASLHLLGIEASKKAGATTKGQDSSSSNEGTQLAEAPPELLKLIELVKKGRTDAMSNHLLKYGMDPSQLLPLTSSTEYDIRRTPTILHLASHHGQAQVVKCLLEKHHVDPTTTTVSAARNSLTETETEAETGEDPSSLMVGTNSFTAYDVAKDKETRNAFRRAMALFSNDWDWVGLAHVPSALTPEMEAEQERKAKEKTRKLLEAERERKKTRETNRPATPVGNSGASSSSTSTASPLAKNLASVSAAHSQLSPELRMRLERERRAAAAEARMAAMRQTETIRRAVQDGKNVCVTCGKSLDGLMPFDKFGRKFCTTECVAKGPA
ncbi:hypothetical protein BG011_000341 [Mortierella polycephala]|uniref:VLRF1 domain-containing protein n=1 Tax=Mortierella polycephala TaxID=41804 RepID=A0A9P6PMJ3_9FUNG|nr:hypothetical protein BG011_000341 [Mortierella polycephala]